MDALSSLALTVLSAVVFFYVLYLVIRRAVAHGIGDADKDRAEERAAGATEATRDSS